MRRDNYLFPYLRAVFQAPIGIVFVILDIVAIYAVFVWVADDIQEFLVLVAFILVTHIGHYLIFRKERSAVEKLKLKLKDIQTNQPLLSLSFLHDSSISSELSISAEIVPRPPDFENLIKKEEKRLKSKYESADKDFGTTSFDEVIRQISNLAIRRPKDSDKFDKEIEEYLEKDFRKYLSDRFAYQKREAIRREAILELSNSGRLPAEDIRVFLFFPDQFRFPTQKELLDIEFLKEEPEPPKAPDPIYSPLDVLNEFTASQRVLSSAAPISPLTSKSKNVRGPFIRSGSENSTEVEFEVDKLLHGFSIEFDPIHFFITDDLIGHSWPIEYEIYSSDLPEPVSSALTIRVVAP